jgi:hypothetical protein
VKFKHFYVWTRRSSHHPFLRVSRKFESIYNLARVKHHNTTHMSHKSTPSPPYPSAGFPRNTLTGIRGCPPTLSLLSSKRYSKVSSNSMIDKATKFAGLHISCMCQYIIKCLFIKAQPTRILIDSSRDYQLGAPNFRSDHSPSFPFSILRFPLIALPGLQLCQLW